MGKWQRVLYQPGIGLGENGERVTGSAPHIALSKEAAKEGMVLLKNEEGLLPLPKGSRAALFGKAVFDYVKGGGGSGDVTAAYTTSLGEGMQSLGEYVQVHEELLEFYRAWVDGGNGGRHAFQGAPVPKEGGRAGEPELPDSLCRSARAFTDTAIIAICRYSGEGEDRPESDYYLTEAEKAMISKVKSYFPRIAVVLNVGSVVDTKWIRDDSAIQSALLAWQGGMEGGLAAAELLCGIGCPSGKLADTFADSLGAYPSTANFFESDDYVEYTDDIYVGYRYFETIPGMKERVVYPFGYGLSYTRFCLNIKKVSFAHTEQELETCMGSACGKASGAESAGGACGKVSGEESAGGVCGESAGAGFDGGGSVYGRIAIKITNAGKVPGKEVLQLYGSAPDGVLGKAKRHLLAFEKTRLLSPGESQVVILGFCLDELASYDDLGKIAKSAYVMEAGEYRFYLGTSVADAEELPQTVRYSQDRIVRQLSPKLVPSKLPRRMRSDGSFEELPVFETDDQTGCELSELPKEPLDGLLPSGHKAEGIYSWPQQCRRGVHPFCEVAEGKMPLGDFMRQIPDAELAELTGGQPNTGVANTWGFGNLPEFGVPNIMTADGPAGLRIQPQVGIYTTAWPCATLLACTWNPDLVFCVGGAGAKEVKENNIAVWLTPAINIHRNPLCGRNFEYYSEDPYLVGKIGGAMVSGIQSQHIAATVKHFALNNKENNRKSSDSRVSERAAREIYLKAFEMIVREAKPWCIMSSYNIVNGCRASECKELLTDILRGEWGFEGAVTSDWWTLGEHHKELRAGNDIKMARGFTERVLEALEKGLVGRGDLERSVSRILSLILKID